jgi:hypothetical protein
MIDPHSYPHHMTNNRRHRRYAAACSTSSLVRPLADTYFSVTLKEYPSIKTRRKYIHVGSTAAPMLLTVLTEGWDLPPNK